MNSIPGRQDAYDMTSMDERMDERLAFGGYSSLLRWVDFNGVLVFLQ